MNANGTGTIDFTAGSTAQLAVVLDSTADGVAHGVQLLQINDPNNEIVSGTAVLQSATAQNYSAASLQGPFVIQLNRWTADAGQSQFGIIGIFDFNGNGRITNGAELDVSGGMLGSSSGGPVGSYTVSSDGRGSLSLNNGRTRGAVVLNSVVNGQAKGLQFLTTKPTDCGNFVISGTALKQ